jgi:hypothetical protein
MHRGGRAASRERSRRSRPDGSSPALHEPRRSCARAPARGAGRRQLHRPRRSVKQLNAQHLLDRTRLLTECLLRDAQLLGGPRKVALASDRDDVAHLPEVRPIPTKRSPVTHHNRARSSGPARRTRRTARAQIARSANPDAKARGDRDRGRAGGPCQAPARSGPGQRTRRRPGARAPDGRQPSALPPRCQTRAPYRRRARTA